MNRIVTIALLSAIAFGFAGAARADLPQPVKNLATQNPVTLARMYQGLPAPTDAQIPSGFAVAEHVVPIYDNRSAPGGVPLSPALLSKAQLPGILSFAAFKLLKGKNFDARRHVLTDQLSLPLGSSQAQLTIGKIDDYLVRAFADNAQPDIGDGKAALITNYSVMKQPTADAAGWIDELRMVRPGLWLGRSFYKGKFWCYIIVYFGK